MSGSNLGVPRHVVAETRWGRFAEIARRRQGCSRHAPFGERNYIASSLIAKSVLAWQMFTNVLID